jgi:hypothetical protein
LNEPLKDDGVSLQKYMETLVSEAGKRTDDRFDSAEKAVMAALATQEKALAAALVSADKLTSAAFVAAKEALAEAQTQLVAYKATANEWRGTLNDLISKIMPRPEIEATLIGLGARITTLEGQARFSSGQKEAISFSHTRGQWTFEKILTILALMVAFASFAIHFWGK